MLHCSFIAKGYKQNLVGRIFENYLKLRQNIFFSVSFN